MGKTMTEHITLSGIGVSSGIACGKAALIHPAPGRDPDELPSVDPVTDGERVRAALALVSTSLLKRAEKLSEESASILTATAQLALDRGLIKAIDKKLGKGQGITQAVDEALEEYAQMLKNLGGYMAERATDLYDLRDRTLCALRGLPDCGIPEFTEPVILVAHDLAPAETATLDPETVRGILIEEGGPTSHTAILAAQLGIPTIVHVKGICEVAEGEMLALDATAGKVIISPSAEEIEKLKERAQQREKMLTNSSGEGATCDGYQVKLLANIGTLDDAQRAAQCDLEGVGLFRTEFLFLDRAEAPSLNEQIASYTQILSAFGESRVVVRTLDAGADKPLSFADLGRETNPALGRRGLRLCQVREDLLDTQLAALAAAQENTQAQLWVMAPMVSTCEEAECFATKARNAGLKKIGVMIEVPAAAICARQLLEIVDFASIGTNDLAQYTMAADRTDGELAPLLNPWQPAVLQMMKIACEGAQASGKPIGVCGEAGGDPLLALVLTGLGITSLSMAPSKIKAVRAALSLSDFTTCQQMAALALKASSAQEARASVHKLASPAILPLL